ncbi:G-protein coupled receptor family C group 6 member A-like [Spea bombifrons]|uniref:G-protein coupled receptor family C group 6 member A-like n=1 Tax=Spea bombifrons TaxID=233779 RepID=UPI00234BBA76|nr:G-protein coupled receptor family C group 6 member A-like [Spea bombifrons]
MHESAGGTHAPAILDGETHESAGGWMVEIWVHHEEPESKRQSMQLKLPSSSVTKKFKMQPSPGKLTIFCEKVGMTLGKLHHKGRSVQSCDIQNQTVAYLDGDIIIGGIFPIHEGVSNLLERTNADDFICNGLQLRNVVKVFSMIYTIEEINNSTLLPGIKLGYAIFDSCSDVSKAIQSTIKLIPELNLLNNPLDCNSTKTIPSVKVIIGEIYSEISVAISRILSLHYIPQISPASSSPYLSDKTRFPSFLRTVPSDMHQTKAISKLIRKFGWNWVGIISSDDDYGHSGADNLNHFLKEQEICAAFSKMIPSYVEHPLMNKEIGSLMDELQNCNLMDGLQNCSAKVVVIFAKGPIVIKIFRESIRLNISRVWIASDIWSISREVADIKNIDKVGAILGLNFHASPIQGFTEYLENLQLPVDGAINHLLEEYKYFRFGCTEEYRQYLDCKSSLKNCIIPDSINKKSPLTCTVANISLANDDFLVENIEWSTTFSTSLAVKSIAYALKKLLCEKDNCTKDQDFFPHELLNEVRQVHFPYNTEIFSFNMNGDFMNGYDIINWHTTENPVLFKIVGQYDIVTTDLTLNESLFFWNTEKNQIPVSKCSAPCSPGYNKKHSFISCCYECIPCPEGYFSPNPDMDSCLKCSIDQWSSNGSSSCQNRTIEYLYWNNAFAVLLVTFTIIGFLLLLIICALFKKYSDSTAVIAAGGKYIYPLIASLLFSLASVCFFIGQPSDIICMMRQPLYGISFTLCVSCILVKSLRIIIAFELANRIKKVSRLSYHPIVIIIILTSFQILICILWLIFKRPFPTEIYTIPHLLIRQCEEGSYVAFGIMLGYIGFLAFACFLLAYKGRKLPEKYNEARSITFSMLIYMFVWVIFIPVYRNTSGMYLSMVQVIAILASVYGVLFCHLSPPCYIILFKRKTCNRELYLQSVFAFYRAKRSVLSVYQRSSHLQVPATSCDPETKGRVSVHLKSKSSGENSIVRRRHKSC